MANVVKEKKRVDKPSSVLEQAARTSICANAIEKVSCSLLLTLDLEGYSRHTVLFGLRKAIDLGERMSSNSKSVKYSLLYLWHKPFFYYQLIEKCLTQSPIYIYIYIHIYIYCILWQQTII